MTLPATEPHCPGLSFSSFQRRLGPTFMTLFNLNDPILKYSWSVIPGVRVSTRELQVGEREGGFQFLIDGNVFFP